MISFKFVAGTEVNHPKPNSIPMAGALCSSIYTCVHQLPPLSECGCFACARLGKKEREVESVCVHGEPYWLHIWTIVVKWEKVEKLRFSKMIFEKDGALLHLTSWNLKKSFFCSRCENNFSFFAENWIIFSDTFAGSKITFHWQETKMISQKVTDQTKLRLKNWLKFETWRTLDTY